MGSIFKVLRNGLPLLVICITLNLCFITQASAQTPICTALSGYDISNLTAPNYWQLDIDGECVNDTSVFDKCTFLFSFCHQLVEIGKCQNSSVCQWSFTRPDDIIKLGEYIYDPFVEREDKSGFYAIYGTGQTIINKFTNESCNVSISFEFKCDPKQHWETKGSIGNAPQPLSFSGILEDSCNYYVKFPYSGACYSGPTTPVTTTVGPDPPPAKICVPPMGYDIDVLTLPPYWAFNIPSGCSMQPDSPSDACTLYVAFCKPFENLIGCNGASACIRYPNSPGSSLIVGNFSGDPFTIEEANGFAALYPSGSDIVNKITNKNCTTSIEITFDCNSTVQWEWDDKTKPGIGPAPSSFVSVSESSCQINVTVQYAGACFKIKPANTTNNLSPGTVLLIIFLSAVTVYLIAGLLYNKLVENQHGLRLIPHYNFWASTISFTIDGFVYVWRVVTCKGTTKKVYESI